MTEIVTIYDEQDRAYKCEVEVGGTRVVRVLESPVALEVPTRNELILESGYQAYELEAGYHG